MADINLTQDEADKLMAMEKRAADEKEWLFPPPGERIAIPVTLLDKRENFILDVTRAQIKLTKATYQNRRGAAIILLRLDVDGPPHTNPDGVEIPCPHLHTFIKRASVISGLSRHPLTETRIPLTSFFYVRGVYAALQYHRTAPD